MKLSAESINKQAPYKVQATSKENIFYFKTDHGVDYLAGFTREDGLLSEPVYQFYIINTNNRKSPRDRKLRDTVMAIIYEFFDAGQSVMLYICDTGDAKQGMRSRLFEYWWRSSPRKSYFIMQSADVLDTDGVMNYAAIVVRLDHPQLAEVVAEFAETVKLLNEKPRE